MSRSRRQQRTISRDAGVRGVGFLTGADVHVRFRPAEAGTGVVFIRADLPDRPSVPAHVRYVVARQRRTTLQRGAATVEMVEHVMAALAGLHIDNCVVELDAGETPGCDGSSAAFVGALEEAGYVEQSRTRDVVSIDRPISVREGNAVLTAYPGGDERLVLSYNLDFGKHTPIGSQSYFLDITPETFRNELADSRTFLLEAEADALKQSGVGRRTKETDLLIFGPDGPINNTLRYPDECVRHKILDMVGDLALAGADLRGHVVAHRSGHQLNAELVRQILDSVIEVEPEPATPVLDIRAVMELLPHRYPILLVDRVLELEPGRRIVAIKNVTCNEPYFQGHWPGRPIMPGVLILESLAQACGLLIAQQVDPSRTVGLIAGIDEVRLRRPVVPGDQLRLEVTLLRWRSKMIDMLCEAWVGEQLVAEGKIRFMLAPNQKLSRPELACAATGSSGNGSGSTRAHD